MKYPLTLLFLVSAMLLSGCMAKPVGHPRCWDVTAVISHDVNRNSWYYLKLKDPDSGQTSYLNTSIFRPYAAGDKICIQKYDDNGISSTRFIPAP